MTDQLKYVEVFTDGACKGNPGIGGWGSILIYKDNIKEFLGNEYTAFGTAIHEVCEKSVLGEIDRNFSTLNKCFNIKFQLTF